MGMLVDNNNGDSILMLWYYNRTKGVFRDCMLVYPNTTVREFCRMISAEKEKHFLYAEGVNGQRVIFINTNL
jgi:hypothetical protein